MAKNGPHIGENIRAIRRLKGMKQAVFAQKLGITQQNVSKMEKKSKVSPKKLEEAAKILGVSVDAIRKFNEKAIFNSNIAFEQNSGQTNNVNSTKEIIDYFKEELAKKDAEIVKLREALERKSERTTEGHDTKLSALK